MSGGVLTDKGDNNCDLDIDGGSDDKENKRWYSQELGLNLWQTTLGAAALLGTGFGTGYVQILDTHNYLLSTHKLSWNANALELFIVC
jgi:hypothetical protein